MAIKLILDSTADVRAALRGCFSVVPLTLRFGEEEFIDGITLSREAFYGKLVTSHHHPATSQAGPDAFSRVFSQLEPGDSAVVITLSSTLSGTYQSACIAAEDFPNVQVVDSGTATVGIGILAEYALLLIDQGMEAPAIADTLREKAKKLRLYAVLDTLEYLKRGGRISAAAAVAGSLLQLKPMIRVDNGRLDTLEKSRGSKQANLRLAEKLTGGEPDLTLPFLLGYTGTSPANMEAFVAQTGEKWLPAGKTPEGVIVSGVIGVHAGPGAWAVAFFEK